ncbi:MAG: hypothetical protein JWO92_2306 [Chitinophagaceae bacterium]|nr:hypothetical protein [Chitinophagaceae bacterium]
MIQQHKKYYLHNQIRPPNWKTTTHTLPAMGYKYFFIWFKIFRFV